MSDIERLRLDVINAARTVVRHWQDNNEPVNAKASVLCKAVDALDEAEKPDPWKLLREARQLAREAKEAPGISYSETDSLQRRIELALQWRKDNPDD